MIVENPNNYKFITFEISRRKNKKYNAIIQNKITGEYKKIPFGDSSYQHYKDITGLDAFTYLNHLDPERRRLYRLRHKKEEKNKFSSGWFALNYLW